MATEIEFLGGPAFRITTSGRTIVIDPYLAEEVGSPFSLDRVKKADLLLLTHGGRTHIGDSIDFLKRTGARLVCGAEVKTWAESYGIPKEQIDLTTWGVDFRVCGIRIITVEARHPSHVRDKQGNFLTGVTHGYILEAETGDRIYHMGDTSIFSDLKIIGMLYRPTIALVPVGAGTRTFHAELSPSEAALACSWLNPKVAVPMHYLVGSGDEVAFEAACKEMIPSLRIVPLKGGETLTL
jgi:L-ascorbate metabolism protein UlaG (beta-lactamase superfamily)